MNHFYSIIYLIILCCISENIAGRLTKEDLVVRTEYGLVRGQKENTLFEERSFYAFRGIPYAKPPLNDLRLMVNFIIADYICIM